MNTVVFRYIMHNEYILILFALRFVLSDKELLERLSLDRFLAKVMATH
ncbi:hypothetical protein DI53_3400 [Sphingobacterium deserti]|uniref:Uncharacterized protein n=1 Tax=Sphingobacterium deserti TaxID=1229276 RepID=A0A0B8SZE0_9SPHI|nr:hypothetical protein DI53_3400 [Sphingobacterium deserti]